MFENFKIKKILKKDLTIDEYLSLPEKIKNDEQIIHHLLECDSKGIRVLPDEIMLKLIQKNKYLINDLSDEQLSKLEFIIPNLSKEFFNKELDAKIQEFFLYQWPQKTFDLLLNGVNRIYTLQMASRLKIQKKYEFHTNYNHDPRDLFTDEELKSIILSLSEQDLRSFISDISEFSLEFVSRFSFDEILSLCKKNNTLLEEFSKYKEFSSLVDEINYALIDNDIAKIVNLDVDKLARVCVENPKYLVFAHEKTHEEYLRLKGKITLDELMLFDRVSRIVVDLMDEDEAFDYIKSDYTLLYYIPDHTYDKHIQMGWIKKKLEKLDDPVKKQKLLKIADSLKDKPVLGSSYGYNTERYQFGRFLFDERIVENNSIEKLEEYRKTYDRDLLIELLSNAYGEHVREIFAERPDLDILNLTTFAMFDKNIYDLFGKGFVNYCITYNLGVFCVLIERMSKDKKILTNFYEYFNVVTSKDETIDINDIYNIVNKYMIFKNIFINIDFKNITEQQLNNINLLINDSIISSIAVDNVEDVNNYHNVRQIAFSNYINSIKDYREIKESIFQYITNYDYEDISGHHIIDKPSFTDFVSMFDIDNITNCEELIDEIGLSKEEVSLLLLLNEIYRMNDIHELRDTFKSVLDNQLDSSVCHDTIEKMRNFFTKNIKDNLTTVDDLEKMKKRTKNGVDIITFKGEDYRFLISYTGMNLSLDYMADVISGEQLLDSWMNFENGNNFISTSLVSSNTSINSISEDLIKACEGHIILVFDNNVDILGMGTTDISASPWAKKNRHSFRFMKDECHDFQFRTMDDFENTINKREAVEGKFDNEITIARYREDIRKEDALTRVMPIGLYVIGKITKEQQKTAEIFNQYYQEHGLGKFRIIQINPVKYGYSINEEEVENEKTSRR